MDSFLFLVLRPTADLADKLVDHWLKVSINKSLTRTVVFVDTPVIDTVGFGAEEGHIVTLPTTVLVDGTVNETTNETVTHWLTVEVIVVALLFDVRVLGVDAE